MMNLSDFKPGDELVIDKVSYIVQPSPDPNLKKPKPYIEVGGNGYVVQLLRPKTNTLHALKAFNQTDARMLEYTQVLRKNRIAELPGLSAAERFIIDPKTHTYLTKKYSDLVYAVLMPWVKGNTWFEVLGDNAKNKKYIAEFTQTKSLYLAKELARVLMELEKRSFAHCDVCSNNIILDLKNPSVSLIDIEDMYLPGTSRPDEFLGGQPGYGHPKTAGDHQWMPEADRFGGGLLICETLCWYHPEIRVASGIESFFEKDELLSHNTKYVQLKDILEAQGDPTLVPLFESLWQSDSIQACPKIAQWYETLDLIAQKRGIVGQSLIKRKFIQTVPTPIPQPVQSHALPVLPDAPRNHIDAGKVALVIFVILGVMAACVVLAILLSNIHPSPVQPGYLPTAAVASVVSKIVAATTEYVKPANTATRVHRAQPTLVKPGLIPIASDYKCPDKDKIELRVGANGKVRKYDVNLREEPIVPKVSDANVVGVLRKGQKL